MLKIYPTLSIRQPWAGLIALGFKDIENRTWTANPRYNGQTFLIHAGKQVDRNVVGKGESILANALRLVMAASVTEDEVNKDLWSKETSANFLNRVKDNEHVFGPGGIIGSAILKRCTFGHNSAWAIQQSDMVHWQFELPQVLPFLAMPGRLGIFQTEYTTDHFPNATKIIEEAV